MQSRICRLVAHLPQGRLQGNAQVATNSVDRSHAQLQELGPLCCDDLNLAVQAGARLLTLGMPSFTTMV